LHPSVCSRQRLASKCLLEAILASKCLLEAKICIQVSVGGKGLHPSVCWKLTCIQVSVRSYTCIQVSVESYTCIQVSIGGKDLHPSDGNFQTMFLCKNFHSSHSERPSTSCKLLIPSTNFIAPNPSPHSTSASPLNFFICLPFSLPTF
jgi:hypothetical protein